MKRRDFMKVSGGVLGGVGLTGCTSDTFTISKGDNGVMISKSGEPSDVYKVYLNGRSIGLAQNYVGEFLDDPGLYEIININESLLDRYVGGAFYRPDDFEVDSDFFVYSTLYDGYYVASNSGGHLPRASIVWSAINVSLTKSSNSTTAKLDVIPYHISPSAFYISMTADGDEKKLKFKAASDTKLEDSKLSGIMRFGSPDIKKKDLSISSEATIF